MIKITEEKLKDVKLEPGLHKKLKLRATEKGKTIRTELTEILMRELDVAYEPEEIEEILVLMKNNEKDLEVDENNE